MSNKVYTVVGTRPQIMKIDREMPHQSIIWTGQHYDYNMFRIFFKELALPKPYLDLNLPSEHSGQMFDRLLKLFRKDKPAIVLVYGDTLSTLMGALAASYANIPLAHIEAGARIFDLSLPEEINRMLVDRISTVRFCFTLHCYKNLNEEKLLKHSHYLRGDPMFDAMNQFLPIKRSKDYQKYILLTIHRNFNADSKERLKSIFSAIKDSGERVIFPVHPRTKKNLPKPPKNVEIIDAVGYKKMLQLESNAKKIITDSGGVEREAYWMRIPCIVLRNATEWVETVNTGWAVLVDADYTKILDVIHNFMPNKDLRQSDLPTYGVNKKIREILSRYL